MGPTRVK